MKVKRTSRGQRIFIGDTAIMVLLWMNWKLPGKLCRMILGVFELMGFIQRRQGRWEESTRSLERAFELDPRNINTLHQIALSYGCLPALC